MGNVYVKVGDITRTPKFPEKEFAEAKAAAAASVANVVKTDARLTSEEPKDKKGVQVDVILTELVPGTNTLTCKLIGSLWELPSKERLKSDLSPRGEAKVVGEKPDVALKKCVDQAVATMMKNVVPTIAAPPKKPGMAGKIYMAPWQVTCKDTPATAAEERIAAANGAIDALIKKNDRFVQDAPPPEPEGNSFQSGMPGYRIRVTITSKIDTKPKTAEVTVKGSVDGYPDPAIVVPGFSTTAKLEGDVSGGVIKEQVIDLTRNGVAKAIQDILNKNPRP